MPRRSPRPRAIAQHSPGRRPAKGVGSTPLSSFPARRPDRRDRSEPRPDTNPGDPAFARFVRSLASRSSSKAGLSGRPGRECPGLNEPNPGTGAFSLTIIQKATYVEPIKPPGCGDPANEPTPGGRRTHPASSPRRRGRPIRGTPSALPRPPDVGSALAGRAQTTELSTAVGVRWAMPTLRDGPSPGPDGRDQGLSRRRSRERSPGRALAVGSAFAGWVSSTELFTAVIVRWAMLTRPDWRAGVPPGSRDRIGPVRNEPNGVARSTNRT